MAQNESFAALMNHLRAGDSAAAAQLVGQYHERLRALAKKRLAPRLRQKVDPDDVLQSVYKSFFLRFERGEFQVEDADSLWSLLTLITIRKCSGRAEYFLAACRNVNREATDCLSASGSLQPGRQLVSKEPTPEEAACLTETLEHLMRGMESWECEILALSLQGHSIEEVSRQVGRAERTVERVRSRIRKRLLRLQAEDALDP